MKAISILVILFTLATHEAWGQKDEKSPTAKFLYKRGYTYPGAIRRDSSRVNNWPDTLFYNTTYRPKLMGSPTIPITFSRVEVIDGKYQVTPTIGIGLGYTWFFGDFIFSENDRIIVVPTFFFGLVADIAVQSDFNVFKPAGLFTGGFIGTSALSLFFGYDLVTKSPSIGLGTRIDFYTLSQKSLRPIGKIRALRKHKKRATPIIDE